MALQLPLSSVRVEFHYTRFVGIPSYAFNISHVVDPRSKLGAQLHSIMGRGTDLSSLKQLLSEGKLSIYSLYRGAKLFYVSMIALINLLMSWLFLAEEVSGNL